MVRRGRAGQGRSGVAGRMRYLDLPRLIYEVSIRQVKMGRAKLSFILYLNAFND